MPSCRVHVTATSVAPPSALFALLADVSTWSAWGSWERAELESTAPDGSGGVGAVRRITSRAFGRVIVSRERVEELVPDRRLVYALLEGLPLEGYRGVVELEPDGVGGTRITWSSSFEPKVYGTGWLYVAFLRTFIAYTAGQLARAAERSVAKAA